MIREIIPNTYRITLPVEGPIDHAYVFLVRTKDCNTLIDVGIRTKESQESLIRGLGELGLSVQDIDQIALTHHHSDHSGGLEFFTESVKVIGHPRLKTLLLNTDEIYKYIDTTFLQYGVRLGVPFPLQFTDLQLIDAADYGTYRPLTKGLLDGEMIPGMGGYQAVYTPGHASSHISYYHPEEGILIGGDVLFSKVATSVWLEPPLFDETERPRYLPQQLETLKKLKTLQLKCVFPSHGEDILEVNNVIDDRIETVKKRLNRVLQHFTAEPCTFYEVYEKMYTAGMRKKLFAITFTESVGLVDELEKKGIVAVNRATTPYQYSLVKEDGVVYE